MHKMLISLILEVLDGGRIYPIILLNEDIVNYGIYG